MTPRPVNALIAIAVSLLPAPSMLLLDRLNRGCGDGLCGFASGLLILGTLLITTIVFVMRSARRNETPAPLRLVPVALWLLPMYFMV